MFFALANVGGTVFHLPALVKLRTSCRWRLRVKQAHKGSCGEAWDGAAAPPASGVGPWLAQAPFGACGQTRTFPTLQRKNETAGLVDLAERIVHDGLQCRGRDVFVSVRDCPVLTRRG